MKDELTLRQSARYREALPTAAEAAAALRRFADAAKRADRVPPRPCKFTEYNGVGRCTHCGIEVKPVDDTGTPPLELIKMVAQEDCEAYRRAEAFAASRLRADTAAWARETAPETREANKFDTALWLVILVIAIILLAFSLGGYINGPR